MSCVCAFGRSTIAHRSTSRSASICGGSITADIDLVPDDDLGYRGAFMEAFRNRGIPVRDVRTSSHRGADLGRTAGRGSA